ncbi:S-adenosyl-L-methionine-dependent methyltransferase [Crucibulum laeve]|uniref:tRNA N(3)-methylcytidine methyltransferase n=1 Tax=Crucibulum laeve TaxID=68775 RepID=A0A5C3M2W4_9AGAR|nr:S-adenosyl-L-methionine-dependent methyltransferase [Crucibulum laeve]
MSDVEDLTTTAKKTTSSVHDVAADKPPFGSRFLTEEADVWSQNAWDHVPPPDDQDETIAKSLEKQRLAPVPQEEKGKYNEKPARHWDNFYKNNASNFFRNRKWLHNEFPELVAAAQPEAGPMAIAEIGCGAGNSVFPLLSANTNPKLSLHAYDYSNHAVKLVQNDPLYKNPPTGTIHAAVWDVTSANELPEDVQPGTIDIVILVFVMSALHPDEWGRAISNIHKMLKPGGLAVFRDYGRYDLTQLRFKGGRLLDDNFYIRGDKTRVYFFELDELALLFTGSVVSPTQKTTDTTSQVLEDADSESRMGELISSPAPDSPAPEFDSLGDVLTSIETQSTSHASEVPDGDQNSTPTDSGIHSTSTTRIHPNLLSPFPGCPLYPLFSIEQLGVDRRLLINRKRQLKMYRVWMQGKFRKR